MKTFLRLAAITLASTALVAGNATASSAAPSVKSVPAATVSTAGDVSIAAAPYPLDYKTKIRIQKRGKKLTFRVTARYTNDAGQKVGIRRSTIEVLRGGKWRTLKKLSLNSSGRGTYKRTDKKKRKYRLVIKATSVYQGGKTGATRKI